MRRASQFGQVKEVRFRLEVNTCQRCGSRLIFSHRVWRKHIIRMERVLSATSLGYRCKNAACGLMYRSAEAESLSLTGLMRALGHNTRREIHGHLLRHEIAISERHVQGLYEAYFALLACTADKQIEAVMPSIEKNGRMVISLDGIQPERGNEALWVVREVLTGVVLAAECLISASSESLQQLLRPVVALRIPILGVISDGQRSIRLAVKALLPEVPHQCCQFHYLRNVALPFSDDDRKLRTNLRKNLRGILAMEKSTASTGHLEAQVMDGYCAAIRAVMLNDGVPPLRPGGIDAYENLERICSSLQKCIAVKATAQARALAAIAARHRAFKSEYLTLKRQHAWLLALEHAINPDNYACLTPVDAVQKAKHTLDCIAAEVSRSADSEPAHLRFAESLRRYTQGFGDSLFQCFSNPLLPRTNNDLERFLRHAKCAHRRTTGRKSWTEAIVRYGELAVHAVDLPREELIRRFGQVSPLQFKERMRQWALKQAPRRQRFRYKKAPEAFLNRLEQAWLDPAIRSQ